MRILGGIMLCLILNISTLDYHVSLFIIAIISLISAHCDNIIFIEKILGVSKNEE